MPKAVWVLASLGICRSDRDEMSILYRGFSIDASYQVSVHLAKRFPRRRFKKIGQSETRIANRNYSAILATLQITSYMQLLQS
jgi:hypothetical protein